MTDRASDPILRIASWNVNSVRKRIDLVARLVKERKPDILCLQECKVADPLFPHEALADLGFEHRAISGQKGYNGVAILSRLPIRWSEPLYWIGSEDRRHIRAEIETKAGPVQVHSLYMPAGGDIPNPERNPKFKAKLAFLAEQQAWWQALGGNERDRVILTGDFNVAPLIEDVWSHEKLRRVVTHTEVERTALTELLATSGLQDAMRVHYGTEQKLYTWWSYRTADWQGANKGRRLDHIWSGRAWTERLVGIEIFRDARGWPEPSDHVPVLADFKLD
ncbi:MAG: exodeoxyribonuclease III [Magnetovibrionaceae bacterium]